MLSGCETEPADGGSLAVEMRSAGDQNLFCVLPGWRLFDLDVHWLRRTGMARRPVHPQTAPRQL